MRPGSAAAGSAGLLDLLGLIQPLQPSEKDRQNASKRTETFKDFLIAYLLAVPAVGRRSEDGPVCLQSLCAAALVRAGTNSVYFKCYIGTCFS